MKLFVPPWKTGVWPRILLAELISTTSWANGERLVNAIVTFPALAVSLLAVNMSVPDGLAAMATVLVPATGAGLAVLLVPVLPVAVLPVAVLPAPVLLALVLLVLVLLALLLVVDPAVPAALGNAPLAPSR